MKHQNVLVITCLFVFLSFAIFTGCNSGSDKDIQQKVSAQLAAEPAYSGVNATVQDGVVTLTGNCDGDGCGAIIEEQLKALKGVKRVENNINADAKTDLTLRTSVQAIVSKYSGVQAEVAGGVIVLRGMVAREQVQPLMNELQALDPAKIDNQLAVTQ